MSGRDVQPTYLTLYALFLVTVLFRVHIFVSLKP